MAKGFTDLILLLLARGAVVCSQPSDSFKGCSVPGFDWAAYSGSSTARMYTMRGAATEDYAFAAGFIKSNINTDEEDDRIEDFFPDVNSMCLAFINICHQYRLLSYQLFKQLILGSKIVNCVFSFFSIHHIGPYSVADPTGQDAGTII